MFGSSYFGSAYFGSAYFGTEAAAGVGDGPQPTPIAPPPSALAQAYARQLLDLLPRGPAWSRSVGSYMQRFMQAAAEEFARIHMRANDLIREMSPRTTNEMLSDWEEALGLPDTCVPGSQTVSQRRAAIIARLTFSGIPNKDFYIDLAAGVGYTVTITEPAANTWRVNAPETTVTWARAGAAVCGDPIRSWGNEILECTITPLRPAHAVLQFAYA